MEICRIRESLLLGSDLFTAISPPQSAADACAGEVYELQHLGLARHACCGRALVDGVVPVEEDCSSVTQSIMAAEIRGGSSRSAACGPSIDCTIDSASIFLIRR